MGFSRNVSRMCTSCDEDKVTMLEIPVSSQECSDAVIGCCRVPSRV